MLKIIILWCFMFYGIFTHKLALGLETGLQNLNNLPNNTNANPIPTLPPARGVLNNLLQTDANFSNNKIISYGSMFKKSPSEVLGLAKDEGFLSSLKSLQNRLSNSIYGIHMGLNVSFNNNKGLINSFGFLQNLVLLETSTNLLLFTSKMLALLFENFANNMIFRVINATICGFLALNVVKFYAGLGEVVKKRSLRNFSPMVFAKGEMLREEINPFKGYWRMLWDFTKINTCNWFVGSLSTVDSYNFVGIKNTLKIDKIFYNNLENLEQLQPDGLQNINDCKRFLQTHVYEGSEFEPPMEEEPVDESLYNNKINFFNRSFIGKPLVLGSKIYRFSVGMEILISAAQLNNLSLLEKNLKDNIFYNNNFGADALMIYFATIKFYQLGLVNLKESRLNWLYQKINHQPSLMLVNALLVGSLGLNWLFVKNINNQLQISTQIFPDFEVFFNQRGVSVLFSMHALLYRFFIQLGCEALLDTSVQQININNKKPTEEDFLDALVLTNTKHINYLQEPNFEFFIKVRTPLIQQGFMEIYFGINKIDSNINNNLLIGFTKHCAYNTYINFNYYILSNNSFFGLRNSTSLLNYSALNLNNNYCQQVNLSFGIYL